MIIASREAFYVWHFRTAQSWTTLRLNDSGKQLDNSQNLPKNERYLVKKTFIFRFIRIWFIRLYHVDDSPAGGVLSAHRTRGGLGSAQSEGERAKFETPTNDPICCMAASDKILIIARESGMLQRYALPNVALTNRYQINTKPHKLALNCNST